MRLSLKEGSRARIRPSDADCKNLCFPSLLCFLPGFLLLSSGVFQPLEYCVLEAAGLSSGDLASLCGVGRERVEPPVPKWLHAP